MSTADTEVLDFYGDQTHVFHFFNNAMVVYRFLVPKAQMVPIDKEIYTFDCN